MKKKLRAHLIILPRWFALPATICGITLGGIISHATPLYIFLAVMTGIFLMAYAHSFNSYADFVITGFDKGTREERSKTKEYTSGQSIIALGLVSEREVLANALLWLLPSLAFAIPLSIMVTPWIWLPWGLIVLCSPWYSWAKKAWHPELPLGLGFGAFAAMLGSCTIPNPPLWTAFLAGIPFTLMWGFAAETVDQWTDWEPNWSRGLRNMGALVGYYGFSISQFLGYLVGMTYLVQAALVMGEMLAPLSMLSLLAFPILTYCMLFLEKETKTGILIGLSGIFLHMILLCIGQAVGG